MGGPDDQHHHDDDDGASASCSLDEESEGGWKSGSSGSEQSRRTAGPDAAVREVEKIARGETTRMQIGKVLVVALILAMGVLVSLGTFLYLAGEEEKDFTEAFLLFAENAGEATSLHVNSIFQAMEGLSAELTSFSLMTSATFPFVTMHQFEVNAMHARLHSGIEIIFTVPTVTGDQKADWEAYTKSNATWLEESRRIALLNDPELDPSVFAGRKITSFIYEQKEGGTLARSPDGLDQYAPAWQSSPPPYHPRLQNYNLFSNQRVVKQYEAMLQARASVFSGVEDLGSIVGSTVLKEDHDVVHDQFVGEQDKGKGTFDHPHAILMTPIFETLDKESDIVAYLVGLLPFDRYLGDLLPQGVDNLVAILRNSCGQSYTYELDGSSAHYAGEGDMHDKAYDFIMERFPFSKSHTAESTSNLEGQCSYYIEIYPTAPFEAEYSSKLPVAFSALVAVVFFLMVSAFIIYDRVVQRRNKKVVGFAAKSAAIVASLFPSNVRGRLMGTKEAKGGVGRLKNFLTSDKQDDKNFSNHSAQPIADLFPDTTILFADIVGFTAWSSVREPTKVFTLLETIYAAFDDIAKRRRVFKVETVGDCYVAVSGLPDPRKDHALAMARFARECMHKMNGIAKKLEIELGPGTGDLTMRMGLHSGPVTAGVLRGDRARFQLFGDTMNTAARMESNSLRGKIQMSEETANLLIDFGKSEWVIPRKDTVMAKGKGAMSTYWLQLGMEYAHSAHSTSDGSVTSSAHDEFEKTTSAELWVKKRQAMQAFKLADDKKKRLIGWHVETMVRLLKQIIVARKSTNEPTENGIIVRGRTPMDEVVEVIKLPKTVRNFSKFADSIQLEDNIVQELRHYISCIADMYPENPFHNFEHASHVTMSVVKLMSRIVAPSAVDMEEVENIKGKDRAYFLHDNTYGITSDPLTQFSCVLSALIHDVEHSGVPNTQLVEEKSPLAEKYNNKSVAEQNSIDLSWNLLMSDDYRNLRKSICATVNEEIRFRQLVVNSVMATDIMDKDLKALRNSRWEKAFSESSTSMLNLEDTNRGIDRKATIVIEHLIQASDVAHTMQHWHVYRQWNERLFMEMTKAYHEGRSKKHPAEFWYKGEIGFFDFYIIPLAKKLKDCGVFGVSSDEYLNYAMKNREEWETRGKEMVEGMIEKSKRYFDNGDEKPSSVQIQ